MRRDKHGRFTRPADREPRDTAIFARVGASERRQIERLAETVGETPSALVRNVVTSFVRIVEEQDGEAGC
jgi:hypothetical protein